ncbi:hypothetical protein JR316_0005616 [Psilocybe cubensis]|uniref:Uncharacterized protein n=2 Tax=Psilocybe cubensis TaxID=181762 RepID=A0ACB8H082_PSICU|nr:hypothetical protein JR316_0005616 [Psilocybe cubensis]KAH9481097.1 hypothetical protein JR316_0005616 [Psilocybe cubensis]
MDSNTRPSYITPPPSFTQSTNPYHSVGDDTYSFAALVASTPSHSGFRPQESALGSDMDFDISSTLPNQPSIVTSNDHNDAMISISTSFHPNTRPTPDTTFSAGDGVIFCVYSKIILAVCPTAFSSVIGDPLSHPRFRTETILLDAPSAEVNIIFHALYGTSPASNRPDFETLVRAVDRMPTYSLSPKALIRPSGSLYELLLFYAPLHPVDAYALAAHHELHPLAVSVSPHLLSIKIQSISDEAAERMGAIYFKKLLELHLGRFAALKGILLRPPHPHPASKTCSFDDQRKNIRAWALASASLVWDAGPDLSSQMIRNALNPTTENLTCEMCLQTLKDKIKDVVVQWSSVRRTI